MNRVMTATRLSVLLCAALVILMLALVGGSIFVGVGLIHQATNANHAKIDADISANDPSRLAELQRYLQTHQTGINQTAALASGVGGYDQSKIVATINGYAAEAGVTVTGFDFSSATPTNGAAAQSGIFNVSLSSPLPYDHFIVFLRLLERGLMPATVTGGSVGIDATNSDNVTVSPMTIKVAGS